MWLPDCEKIEDMFIRFDRIHERDGRTDGRTSRDGIGRAYEKHRAANTDEFTALRVGLAR